MQMGNLGKAYRPVSLTSGSPDTDHLGCSFKVYDCKNLCQWHFEDKNRAIFHKTAYNFVEIVAEVKMFQLDELDQQILKLLQEDGRASHVEIARQLEVGHTRVRDRIHRMEEAGVITGYVAQVDPLSLGYSIHAIIHVRVDQQEDFDEFANQLMQMDEVVEVFNITGEYDAIVRIWVKDFKHLRQFLYGAISELPAHQHTVSSMVLDNQVKSLTLS